MKIVHVVGQIDEASAGPSLSVPRLAGAMARAGHEVAILSVAIDGPPDQRSAHPLAPGVPHTRHKNSAARVPMWKSSAFG